MDPGFASWRVGAAEALLLGLALDAVAGDLRWMFRAVPHPVAALGALVDVLDARLNRATRPPGERRWRGALVVVAVVALAAGVGFLVHRAFAGWRWGWLVDGAVIGVLVAQRSLHDHVAAVGARLAAGDLAGARVAVGQVVGRDPAGLDAA